MTKISTPTILVASDNTGDAALVKKLLNNEFENVFTSTDPDNSAADFVRHPPDVLVLAFNTLDKSQHYYLRLSRLCTAVHLKPYNILILCNKDELRQVYALCRDGVFDDYILFWPMIDDALQLPMSVHLALRELAVLRDGGFAAQARRLVELETLLDQQMVQGVQHIKEAGHAVEQSQRGIGAAVDEFSRRLTQGELPELVEVRNANGLAREIAHLKEGEVRQRLDAIAEAERVRPTVLLVDDDKFQHKIVSNILGDGNYHLVFAARGVEALSILRKTRPDLILMDVMMPDMDGLEVVRQIKTVPRLANIPVIMITGKGEKNVITESLKVGAIDFIVKPFARDTLLGKVAKVLRGTR